MLIIHLMCLRVKFTVKKRNKTNETPPYPAVISFETRVNADSIIYWLECFLYTEHASNLCTMFVGTAAIMLADSVDPHLVSW